MTGGGFKEILRSQNVAVAIFARFFCFRNAGDVEHVVDVVQCRLEGVDAVVTATDNLDWELADPAQVGPAVANEAAHLEPALEQEFNGMTSDETRTAGNEECLNSCFLSKIEGFR